MITPKALDREDGSDILARMKFLLPFLAWLVMGTIIGVGVVMFVVGKGAWLMILAVLGFIFMASKYGCLTQH